MSEDFQERRVNPQRIDPQTFELLMKAMDTMRDDIKADISELKTKFSNFEAQHAPEFSLHNKEQLEKNPLMIPPSEISYLKKD
jgi:hypothetical protein